MINAGRRALIITGATGLAVTALLLWDKSFQQHKQDLFEVMSLLAELSRSCATANAKAKLPKNLFNWSLVSDGASARYEYRGASAALKSAVIKVKFDQGAAGCEADTTGVSNVLDGTRLKGVVRLPF
jgi:hypothetical protein